MIMRSEFLGYGAAVLLFGGVVLWAGDATWPVILTFFGLGVGLLVLLWASARRAPRVLLVGERADAPARDLVEALGDAGYDCCRCAGPRNRPCPVLFGGSCPAAADRPVAAVILRHPDDTGPLPPCGQALLVPAIAAEEGSTVSAEVSGRNARVGLGFGPDPIVRTLEDLLVA
jgi:hypothetical protein